jgi:hypothetical protein
MIPVLLLARNFVRQNRWLLAAFMFWPFLLGAFAWSPHHAANREDVADDLKMEVFYGLVVVTFLSSSAIYNEKRSRRIIGVLSKSVSRLQYLLGLWTGACCFAALYFLMTCASVLWLLGYSEAIIHYEIFFLLRGLAASLWVTAVGLFFSTFLYPFAAATLAGGAALVPLALSRPNAVLAPVAVLLQDADSFVARVEWTALAAGLAESVLFLLLAAQIFVRRDVTVSIE